MIMICEYKKINPALLLQESAAQKIIRVIGIIPLEFYEKKVNLRMINLSGKWKLEGHQTNVDHSAWKADLVLNQNGTLTWKETQGANVGATRTGNWSFNGKTFTMSYMAPKSGLVQWQSDSVTATSMSNGKYTTQAGPQPVGWGGVWRANKV